MHCCIPTPTTGNNISMGMSNPGRILQSRNLVQSLDLRDWKIVH